MPPLPLDTLVGYNRIHCSCETMGVRDGRVSLQFPDLYTWLSNLPREQVRYNEHHAYLQDDVANQMNSESINDVEYPKALDLKLSLRFQTWQIKLNLDKDVDISCGCKR